MVTIVLRDLDLELGVVQRHSPSALAQRLREKIGKRFLSRGQWGTPWFLVVFIDARELGQRKIFSPDVLQASGLYLGAADIGN
jgi:hypothetical protein